MPASTRHPKTLSEAKPYLREPFPMRFVELRPGKVMDDRQGRGKKAQAMPYIDPRVYMARLDRIDPEWSVSFRAWDENKLICDLTILGVTRSSTGEEYPPMERRPSTPLNMGTTAEAQAFKRACAAFGLGRYLYAMEMLYAPCDDKGRFLNPRDVVFALYLQAGIINEVGDMNDHWKAPPWDELGHADDELITPEPDPDGSDPTGVPLSTAEQLDETADTDALTHDRQAANAPVPRADLTGVDLPPPPPEAQPVVVTAIGPPIADDAWSSHPVARDREMPAPVPTPQQEDFSKPGYAAAKKLWDDVHHATTRLRRDQATAKQRNERWQVHPCDDMTARTLARGFYDLLESDDADHRFAFRDMMIALCDDLLRYHVNDSDPAWRVPQDIAAPMMTWLKWWSDELKTQGLVILAHRWQTVIDAHKRSQALREDNPEPTVERSYALWAESIAEYIIRMGIAPTFQLRAPQVNDFIQEAIDYLIDQGHINEYIEGPYGPKGSASRRSSIIYQRVPDDDHMTSLIDVALNAGYWPAWLPRHDAAAS